MNRNTNPNIVVMDRKIADSLMHYARIGAAEAGSDVEAECRHVRRFNAPVSEEHQRQLEQERTDLRAKQQRVKDLLRTHAGKQVWHLVYPLVYSPVKLLSVAKGNKTSVRIHDAVVERVSEYVDIDSVLAELPEGYRLHEMGQWKGRYVANNKMVGSY